MWVSLMAFAVLGVGGGYVAADDPVYTKCTDVPNQPFSQPEFVAASPWMMLRSSDPAMTCTVALMTGPTPFEGNTNYTVLLIRENVVTYAFTLNSSQPQDHFTLFTTCGSADSPPGLNYEYKFLHNNLTAADAYFITYACDDVSGNITLVKGYARNPETGPTVDRVIEQYLSHVPGAETTIDVWLNCPYTPTCGGFFK